MVIHTICTHVYVMNGGIRHLTINVFPACSFEFGIIKIVTIIRNYFVILSVVGYQTQ
jgi:hypothetical protein